MDSESEAFAKFSTWKKSKTSLNVTVIERGKSEEIIFGRISATDERVSLVGIVGETMHSFSDFNVHGADFFVEDTRVVVSRDDMEWLIFEEFTCELNTTDDNES